VLLSPNDLAIAVKAKEVQNEDENRIPIPEARLVCYEDTCGGLYHMIKGQIQLTDVRSMKEEGSRGITLHAAWRGDMDGTLTLYGEDLDLEIAGDDPPMKTHWGGKIHPFSASFSQLKEALRLTFGRVAADFQFESFTLPTRNGRPLPSPEFGDTTLDYEGRETKLDEWTLQSFTITAGRAMKVLLKMKTTVPGITIGRSLLFWRSLCLFGIKLVSAGYCIPSRTGWQIHIPESIKGEYTNILLSAPKSLIAPHKAWSAGDLDRVIRSFLNIVAREIAAPHFKETESFQNAISVYWRKDQISMEEWIRRLGGDMRGLDKRGIPKSVQEWFTDSTDTATRLVIDLNEPDESEFWSTSVSVRTPEGVFPLHELAAHEDKHHLLFGDLVQKTQESLSLAEKIFPPIARGDQRLTEDEVIDLLTKKGNDLLAAGISLNLPSWCRRGVPLPSLNLKTSGSMGFFALSDLLDFDWTVSVGEGIDLSAEEFRQLVDEKRPLVRLKDRWVLLSPDDLARAAKTIPKKGRLTLAEAMQLSQGEELEGWASTEVTFPKEIEDAITRLFHRDSLTPVLHPEGFIGTLRHYQQYGAGWLMMLDEMRIGGCLADDMGLGKTIQVIAYLLERKNRIGSMGPTLIICPMSVLGTWKREFGRFAPDIRCCIHHGTERSRAEDFSHQMNENDVILTSYAILVRDIEILKSQDWEIAILDEAQNIKNPASKQARAARSIRSNRRFALTGTPVENRLHELWSIMDFLNPGYLGSLDRFRKRFALPIEKGKDENKSRILKHLISPFLLRRMKTDEGIAADLPEKVEMKIYCQLSPEQAAAYQAVVDSLITDLDSLQGIAKRGRILATLTKLKQVCDHPDLLRDKKTLTPGRSKKIERLYEIITEILDNGEKALIFTQFATFGELIAEDLRRDFNLPVFFLSGSTPRSKREEMIHAFQESGGPPLFVLSLRAGGTGITLTHATHVIHLDRWWNPAVENQATDRTYRIGQQENVFIHLMISEGTIEEKIDALLIEKKRIADSVIGGGEDWIGELSDDDIRKLLFLEKGGE
jgi:superfamily II DNA or RNA helicase